MFITECIFYYHHGAITDNTDVHLLSKIFNYIALSFISVISLMTVFKLIGHFVYK